MLGFRSNKQRLRLVIGLNRVDEIGPGNWDARLNMPSPEQMKSIEQRCEYLIKMLAKHTNLPPECIEYYSAHKRFRLIQLLSTVIKFADAGFRLEDVEPKDPFELASPDVKEFANSEKQKRRSIKNNAARVSGIAELISKLETYLSINESRQLRKRFSEEMKKPPRLAIIGKAGVGKTTTVNSLFNAKWKTSHASVGTTGMQRQEFDLETGGSLMVIDLPGYGRSINEDQEYDRLYEEYVSTADVVLLVIQADTRDLADDEEMIAKIVRWLQHNKD